MPLYTILHHVNSFVTEWILISISTIFCFSFLFTDFFFTKRIAAAVLYYYTFSIAKLLAAKKGHALLFFISSSFICLFSFSFFISKKKSLSFSFSIPASIWQDFSRSPPPEPAPHDPALLVYKQQLQHLESNRGGAFDLNPEHQSQDSCNSQM